MYLAVIVHVFMQIFKSQICKDIYNAFHNSFLSFDILVASSENAPKNPCNFVESLHNVRIKVASNILSFGSLSIEHHRQVMSGWMPVSGSTVPKRRVSRISAFWLGIS